jgi:hypothetical protein
MRGSGSFARRDAERGEGLRKEGAHAIEPYSRTQGDLMNFEQNLFISYAHIDDQPLTPGEKGWITRFHATLKAILSMRMGREAKIWRDEKLQGNDVFSDEIVAQFKKSAALISIIDVPLPQFGMVHARGARILSECAADWGGGGRQQSAGVQSDQDAG